MVLKLQYFRQVAGKSCSRIPPLDRIPNALDIRKGPTDLKRLKQNYEIYACANELEKKSSKVQIANFLYEIGEDMVDIYN